MHPLSNILFVLIYLVHLTCSEDLESISPVKEFNLIKPVKDNGQEKISSEFKVIFFENDRKKIAMKP